MPPLPFEKGAGHKAQRSAANSGSALSARIPQQRHGLPDYQPRPCHAKHWARALEQGAGHKHKGRQPVAAQPDADDRDPRDTITCALQILGRGSHRVAFKLRALGQ